MNIWKAVTEFPGYDVSNTGFVRSNKAKGGTYRVLKPWLQKHGGYPAVKLRKAGRSYTVVVHKLVLDTFVGLAPDNTEACHRDGNPENNFIENLYWGTRTENVADMYRHGTYAKERPSNTGELHTNAKLTNSQAEDIRNKYVRGRSKYFPGNVKELADEYGVNCNVIYGVVSGKTYQNDHL